MKQEQIRSIKDALESQNLETLNSSIQRVLNAEVQNLPADSLTIARLANVLTKLTFPVKIEDVQSRGSSNACQTGWPVSLCWIIGVTLVMLVGVKINMILAAVLAIAIAFGLFFIIKKRSSECRSKSMMTIATNAQDIGNRMDGVVSGLRTLFEDLKQDHVAPSSEPQSLDVSFPGVINWLQDRYTDCDEFGPESKAFFQKRIRSLLGLYHYDVIDYDENTNNYFDFDYSNRIKSIEQLSPAIIDRRSQRIVKRGMVLFPE